MSVAFCTWGRFDSPEVVGEWWESLDNGVFEFLDVIMLRHDIVLHD